MCKDKDRNQLPQQAQQRRAPPQGRLPCQQQARGPRPPVGPPPPRRVPRPPPGPPPQRVQQVRLLIRVVLHQDTGTVVPRARVTVDGAPFDCGDDGVADCGLKAPGNHTVRVTSSLVRPLNEADPAPYYLPRAGDTVVNLTRDGEQFDVQVDQCVRAKVGVPLDVPGATTREDSWIRFYVPATPGCAQGAGTGHAIRLTLATSRGNLEDHGANPRGPVFATAPNHSWRMTAADGRAWYYVQLKGAGANATRVTLELKERAYARLAAGHDAAPLIPWTFYFWPTPASENMSSKEPIDGDYVRSPLWAYDVRCGVDPTAGGSAFHWESDVENGHHDTLGEWSGHCNQAATASILFEEPPDDYTWSLLDVDHENRWLRMDAEDLKLLATEFAGHRVRAETLVTISETMVEGGSEAERAKLIPGIANIRLGVQLAMDDAAALRRYAAEMFSILQQRMGGEGHALLTDVRTSVPANARDRNAAASQVWNQAIYLYDAVYAEHARSTDHGLEERQAQDIKVTLRVYWNEDYWETYQGGAPTATVTDQGGGNFDIVPRRTDRRNGSLWRELGLRLQFSTGGSLNAADPTGVIESCTGRNGTPFFLLRYLQRISQVAGGTVSNDGNPRVDNRIFRIRQAAQPVLKLRRYAATPNPGGGDI